MARCASAGRTPSFARYTDYTTGYIVSNRARLPSVLAVRDRRQRRAPPRLPALRAPGSFRLCGPVRLWRIRVQCAAVPDRAPPAMAVLQLDDKQFPLSATTTRIGAGADADVVLPTDASVGVQAVIERTGDHALAIRRAAPEAEVRVNGVLLGPEPTPLMHGDKVEVAGLELRFADESKRGATQYMSLEAIPPADAMARRTGAPRATLATGGRLVSLVDGKEYTVSEKGLVIGRDAGSDVVVPRNEVSRRHAEVAPTDSGYVVRDMSSNGVYVNGERVQGSQRLARADVIRVGGEEFRFYADVENPTPASSSQATGEGVVLRTDTPAPSLANTLFNQRAVGDPRAVVATLEVLNEGPSKGVRYQIRTALAHIGRGTDC